MTEAHSQRAHAKLSPSSAHRWFKCAGSVRMSEGIPSTSSFFADEGTAAHELAQHCLSTGFDADRFLGEFINIDGKTSAEKFLPHYKKGARCFEVTDEMAESVQVYLDEVNSLIEDGDEWEVEAKLDLSHIPGMDFGTGDFVRYRPSTKELAVRDLKYGKGVPVEVDDNEQLLTYAEGTARRFNNRGLASIDLGIVQPRCPHRDGPVRKVIIDVLDLVEFRFKLTAAVNATLVDDAPLNPGVWCRFCPAAATCPALRKHSLETAELEFGDEPPKVGDMSTEDLAGVLAKATVLEDWIKRVKERAHEVALAGGLPGFKFVRSTSHRKWKDEEAAVKYMVGICDLDRDDLYSEPKIKSPAAIEKALGAKRKKEIADLVHKPPGKIILVPESDSREPVKPDAESEFDAGSV